MNISFEESLAELLDGLQSSDSELFEMIAGPAERLSAGRQHLIEESMYHLLEQIELEDQLSAQRVLLKQQDLRQGTTWRTNLINELDYYFDQVERAGFVEALTGVQIELPELNIPIPQIEAPQFDLGEIPRNLALPTLTTSADGSAVVGAEGGRQTRIDGDEWFQKTVAGYIEELNKSKEGRRVWAAAAPSVIYPGSGGTSYCHGNAIELSLVMGGVLGFGVFCHELWHCYQSATGGLYGVEAEHEANAWAAARCIELGHPIDALFLGFSIIDPITNIWYYNYYNQPT